ncbi:MAG: hypothetical protein K0R71_1137 [Bacillales bacterium]|jgi:flagellar biosynthesis/type III secretory pathway chaperone|nr:hypothetical protein [Bacillales bacterium]
MGSILELKQTLTNLIETHRELLDLAKQKQIILVNGKILELQNIIIKESKNIDLVVKLDENREQAMKEFLVEKGSTETPLTMDQFIDKMVEPEVKQWFIDKTRQLRDVIQELSLLNKNNQELIQMNLSYIQYSINILLPKEPTIGYGKDTARHSAKLLDAKI